MAGFFNPANPQFRRGVLLASIVGSSAVGFNILLTDFGSQEHVFSAAHRFLNPKIDALFGVTEEHLKKPGSIQLNGKNTVKPA
jgi:hypothetical protein